jgi:SAM-dependent methyltransferase
MSVAAERDRLEAEAAFHDELVESGGRPADRFYAINRESPRSAWNFYCELLLHEAGALSRNRRSPRILEYGSGIGSYSALMLAEHGFGSVGVDISPASVAAAQAHADAAFPGLGLDYRVMNCEALDLDDASFDLVCGNGILHHLVLERAYGEIARVTAPGGCAVFSEPLGHNPLINLYRRRTPDQRTADEHPLRVDDLRLAGRYFADVRVNYFHLFDLLALPFVGKRAGRPLLRALARVDGAAFRLAPPLRRQAWYSVLRLARSV